MANMPGIVIKVTSQVGDAVSGLNKVNRAMGRTATAGQKLGRGLKIAGGAAIAAGAAFVAFSVDAAQAAAAEDKELAILNKTLENLGFKAATDDVNDFIDATARATSQTDSDIRPAFAKLVTATRDVADAQRLLGVAVDLAAQKQIPLETATAAVAKAATGQMTALKKLVPGVKDLNELAKVVGGADAAAFNTLEGAVSQLGETWGEVQESFGHGLVGDGQEAIKDIQQLEQALNDFKPTAEDAGSGIRDFATSFLTGAAAIHDAVTALEDNNYADAFAIIHPENRAEWDEARNRVNGVVASAAELAAEFDRTTAAAHRAARAIQTVRDATADPLQGAGVHDYYGRIQNAYVRGLQAKGKRVRVKAAKKAERAEALAEARKAEIAKRRAEARSGSKFGGQRAFGQASC